MAKKRKHFERERLRLSKRLAALENENAQHETSIASMRRLVAEHDRARTKCGDDSIDRGRFARRRMQMIVNRRKLIDLARAQTEEIDYLRSEIDRLKERSFPSFSRRNASALPDEKIGN